MYKLSTLYKHVILNLTGIKNDVEFETLMLICESYMSAKEDELIDSSSAECDDE